MMQSRSQNSSLEIEDPAPNSMQEHVWCSQLISTQHPNPQNPVKEKHLFWHRSLVLLQHLSASELEADGTTYEAAMTTCRRSQHWSQAYRLLAHAGGRQRRQRTRTVNGAIGGEPWPLSLQMVLRMKQQGVRMASWMFDFGRCSLFGEGWLSELIYYII